MHKSELAERMEALSRAISFVEAALHECDEQGLLLAAIDLSSALDKLRDLKDSLP